MFHRVALSRNIPDSHKQLELLEAKTCP